MSDRSYSRQLGFDAELLVAKWFKDSGHTVDVSENKYDMAKDLVVNGKSVEVKLQTVYTYFGPTEDFKYKPAFTVPIEDRTDKISTNQLNKCMNVERLIFVKRPSDTDLTIKFYEAPKLGSRNFYIIKNKRDRRLVAGFLVESMKELHTITDKYIVNKFKTEYGY